MHRAPNVDVHWGDALALDLAALRPAPTKLVANLPYNVATPIVAESLAGLPSLELWCVMVQREVADRFFAEPSTKAYGAVSVLVQLAARRTGFHPVARTVFRPPPNVDSALVAFRRLPLPDRLRPGEDDRRGLVRAPPQDAPELGCAGRLRAARASGRSARGDRPLPGPGAEALEPAEFVALAEAPRMDARSRPAKINLALVVGPAREDGKHEVATVLQRVDLGDRVSIEPAATLAVTGFAGDTLVREALGSLAAAAGVEPRWRATIAKRIPVAAGLGGGSSDAATALRLANETLDNPLAPGDLHSVAATVGADVPFFLADGPQIGRGDGSELEAGRSAAGLLDRRRAPARCDEGVDRRRLPPFRRPRRCERLEDTQRNIAERARCGEAAPRSRGAPAKRPRVIAPRC